MAKSAFCWPESCTEVLLLYMVLGAILIMIMNIIIIVILVSSSHSPFAVCSCVFAIMLFLFSCFVVHFVLKWAASRARP